LEFAKKSGGSKARDTSSSSSFVPGYKLYTSSSYCSAQIKSRRKKWLQTEFVFAPVVFSSSSSASGSLSVSNAANQEMCGQLGPNLFRPPDKTNFCAEAKSGHRICKFHWAHWHRRRCCWQKTHHHCYCHNMELATPGTSANVHPERPFKIHTANV